MESPGGGMEVGEVVSPGRLGSAGEVASTARIDFWVSRRGLAREPRPTVSLTVKPITASKNTNAAACHPDISRPRKREGGSSVLIASGTKCLARSDGKLASRLRGKSPVEISAAEPTTESPAPV
jgi:hypothetical protein